MSEFRAYSKQKRVFTTDRGTVQDCGGCAMAALVTNSRRVSNENHSAYWADRFRTGGRTGGAVKRSEIENRTTCGLSLTERRTEYWHMEGSGDWPADLHPIRGIMSMPQLLVAADGAVLIDTGFPGDAARIRCVMESAGVRREGLRAILLTHGHIDHAGNAAEIQAWTGAPIYAHRLEQPHLDGNYPYAGAAKVCGVLEAVGRTVTRYRRTSIDVEMTDGDLLPFCGGLRVVHLPGHTVGHCGFYSLRHDLLFSGDLWVRFMMRTQVSPRIFSDVPELRWESLRKARSIGARWIVPGHYDIPNATKLRARFEELCDEIERGRRPTVI